MSMFGKDDNCDICGEERIAKVHTDTELHPDDAIDGLTLHRYSGGLPIDFEEIDADEAHWAWAHYEGRTWIVPNTDAKSDMTDAMMSEIAHSDDTVEPLKLTDKLWYKFAMAYLMQDGNLDVPGGRYGHNTRTCAEIAIVMAMCMQYHNGEPITYYSLNSDMSMVVNSSDGVTTLISESAYIFSDENASLGVDVKELLGDEYTPQTALEKIAAHCEVEIDDNAGDNPTLSITMDEDDAEKLIEAILSNEGPFFDRQA